MLSSEAILGYRKHYPGLEGKSYFNFGGQGPMANETIEAIFESYRYVQKEGPFSGKLFEWLDHEIKDTRSAFARLFGGQPHCYAITQNATEGVNIVLWGIDWQAGDELLLSDCEHPGVVNVAETVASRFSLSLKYFPISGQSEEELLAALDRAITKKTRVFAFSNVLWNTGEHIKTDKIVALCHERNVQVLVDGAQSAGVLPVDLVDSGIDYYAFTCHKWLCGPEGTGGLYISEERLSGLLPTFVGWRYLMPADMKVNASRFEVATSPFPLLAGLRQAIQLHDIACAAERFEMILANARYFRELLAARGFKSIAAEAATGLVSFSLGGKDHHQALKEIESKGFYMRTIPKPDALRASLHYFSTREEIEALVEILSEVVRSA